MTEACIETLSTNTIERPTNADRARWALIAILPYALLYLSHFFYFFDGTGFIQADQPYYSANGREVFERGNGIAYPNPYDPSPDAPTIYFHWLPWLLGAGVKLLGFDPGYQYAALGLIGAAACAWVTLLLVEEMLPSVRFRNALFLIAMWGGGIACAASMIWNIGHGQPAGARPFAFDPGEGWWFLSWGRNLLFPTESIYHALAAGSSLALLRGRWWTAAIATILVAGTHPFTGVQVLAINGVWLSILLFTARTRGVLACWLVLAAAAALFIWYYAVFLNSFDAHRALRETWELPWTLGARDALLAFGPIGVLAAWRLISDRKIGSREAFWLVMFGVSLLLAKHELFVARPMQPIHFAGGYLWLPLYLLALPLLQRWLVAAAASAARQALFAGFLVLGTLAFWDNATFIKWHSLNSHYAYQLSPAEKEMFEWMDSKKLDGVLLCPDPSLSYLSATYTGIRPYRGHFSNTPESARRWEQIERWASDPSQRIEWLNPIDYILVSADAPRNLLRDEGYLIVHENNELVLFRRK